MYLSNKYIAGGNLAGTPQSYSHAAPVVLKNRGQGRTVRGWVLLLVASEGVPPPGGKE